jgi:hypothetical protein
MFDDPGQHFVTSKIRYAKMSKRQLWEYSRPLTPTLEAQLRALLLAKQFTTSHFTLLKRAFVSLFGFGQDVAHTIKHWAREHHRMIFWDNTQHDNSFCVSLLEDKIKIQFHGLLQPPRCDGLVMQCHKTDRHWMSST